LSNVISITCKPAQEWYGVNSNSQCRGVRGPQARPSRTGKTLSWCRSLHSPTRRLCQMVRNGQGSILHYHITSNGQTGKRQRSTLSEKPSLVPSSARRFSIPPKTGNTAFRSAEAGSVAWPKHEAYVGSDVKITGFIQLVVFSSAVHICRPPPVSFAHSPATERDGTVLRTGAALVGGCFQPHCPCSSRCRLAAGTDFSPPPLRGQT